jgi:nucleoside recognition membrane protein YjiH
MHSALQALGVHAQHIDLVWRTMLWICGLMYLLVIAFLIDAIRRRRDSQSVAPRVELQSDSPQVRRMSIVLGGWIGLSACSHWRSPAS